MGVPSAATSPDVVLNGRKAGWFQNSAIIKLNLILLLSMISSYATGFDGSMMTLTSPSSQAPLVSVYNSLYSTGAVAAAWITFGTFRLSSSWAWRIPSLLQAASSVIQLLLCRCIDESPRWLVAHDRVDAARALIAKRHAAGAPDDPLVAAEVAQIAEALRLEAAAAQASSYLTFFATRGNRRRFAIVLAVGFFSQWSGNGLVSYYLALVLDSIGYESQATQTLVNALLQIWMWTALEATYEKETELHGRGSPGVAKGVLALIFLYNFFFSIGWAPLQVTYVVEILPYNLRARGLVLYNLFVALALIFNQYVNPVGVTNSKWRYYVTYDVWLFVELVVVYFLFVETSGKSLEETAAILDGDEATEKLQENARQVAEAITVQVLDEKTRDGRV
ncbi:hypothetical protein SLS58_010773 [Diplodia intermedia]|uniref:Hexose transporter n=1 Tax=Diplodia intermedia TaxID=856260 RepID=A0ABR3T3W6_9PEZI